MSKKTSHQILSFAKFGAVSTSTDFLVYVALISLIGSPSAKIAGFISGMVISFSLNRRVTFRHEGHVLHSGTKFLIAYILSMTLNVAVNELLLQTIPLDGLTLGVTAFLVASAVSVALNFTSMRFWIFR